MHAPPPPCIPFNTNLLPPAMESKSDGDKSGGGGGGGGGGSVGVSSGGGGGSASSGQKLDARDDVRSGRINIGKWLEDFLFGSGLVWMLFIPWCLQPLVMFTPKRGEPGAIWETQFFPITEEQFYYFISVVRKAGGGVGGRRVGVCVRLE